MNTNGWILRDKVTKSVMTFPCTVMHDGEQVTLAGGHPPRHAASSGKVWQDNFGQMYYPHIFGLEWVLESEDKLAEADLMVRNAQLRVRTIREIAREIKKDWKKVYFGAVPYLDAMMSLERITDKYIMDDAKSIIIYFLANAQTYRGETAKRCKAELKKLEGVK